MYLPLKPKGFPSCPVTFRIVSNHVFVLTTKNSGLSSGTVASFFRFLGVPLVANQLSWRANQHEPVCFGLSPKRNKRNIARHPPGGNNFAPLVANQLLWQANQHEPACFGLSSYWSFPSRSGILLHDVVQPWLSLQRSISLSNVPPLIPPLIPPSYAILPRPGLSSIRSTELLTSYRNNHIPYGSSYLVCLTLGFKTYHSESLPLLLLFSPSVFLEATLVYVFYVLKPSLILPVARVYKHTNVPRRRDRPYDAKSRNSF